MDFVYRGNAPDGVHVLQTFFSETQSEEIQIQGRTARQAKKGTYRMILLASELATFDVTTQQCKDAVQANTLYETLTAARIKFVEKQIEEMKKKAKRCEEAHEKSLTFVENMRDSRSSAEEIFKFMMQ